MPLNHFPVLGNTLNETRKKISGWWGGGSHQMEMQLTWKCRLASCLSAASLLAQANQKSETSEDLLSHISLPGLISSIRKSTEILAASNLRNKYEVYPEEG